jgi:hypothetical protein
LPAKGREKARKRENKSINFRVLSRAKNNLSELPFPLNQFKKLAFRFRL